MAKKMNSYASGNNTTELIFILDKSGSMCGMESDTIGGFNSVLRRQKEKEAEGEVLVTTVLFNHSFSTLHDRKPIREVKPLTEKEYTADGCTALLDAVGTTLEKISTVHRYARKEDVPAHTMAVIITDGLENSSTRYSKSQVRKMISKLQEKDRWEFVFLGANIDAVEAAEGIGISGRRAARFHNDQKGVMTNFGTIDRMVTAVRKNSAAYARDLEEAMEDVRADYASRPGD